MQTRRERLKSVLYLTLKKRKAFKTVKGVPYGLFENPVCHIKKIEGGPFEGKTNSKKGRTVPKKNEIGDPSVSSAFANARKCFWLKQGLEPVTVNRVKSVHTRQKSVKSGTHTMSSVV